VDNDPSSSPTCRACVAAALRRGLAALSSADGTRRLRLLKRAGVIAAGGALTAAAMGGVPFTTSGGSAATSAAIAPAAVVSTTTSTTGTTVALEPPSTVRPGYQLVTSTGAEFAFGATASASPPPALARPAIAVARTPSGTGSWRVTADGGVITSGDARFFGSLGRTRLARPVVAVDSTPTGAGYWLVSSDGGVFAFGDARYLGGMAGKRLAGRIVGLASTPSGAGYWLVSSDGGVFAFGDARYLGGMAGKRLAASVVSIAPTEDGNGYWLAGSDAGVFAFGDAAYYGRPKAGSLRAAIVGMAASESGNGYWLAAADGGVFTYGDAPFLGSSGGRVHVPVVAIAAGTGDPSVAKADAVLTSDVSMRSSYGYDISWPQCDEAYPQGNGGFAILGVTGGHPLSHNRCLADQWAWVRQSGHGGGLYINLATPVVGDPDAMHGPAGSCGTDELACQAWNFSANNVEDAVAYATASGASAPLWWLDVEGANRWSPYQNLNAYAVKAAVETLRQHGIAAGVYSTPRYWREITGRARLDIPVWVASTTNQLGAPDWCSPLKAFTGGPVALVQALPGQFDTNFACDGVTADPTRFFDF
jgi:hypothetical protein